MHSTQCHSGKLVLKFTSCFGKLKKCLFSSRNGVCLHVVSVFSFFFHQIFKSQPRGVEKSAAWGVEQPRMSFGPHANDMYYGMVSIQLQIYVESTLNQPRFGSHNQPRFGSHNQPRLVFVAISHERFSKLIIILPSQSRVWLSTAPATLLT